MSSHHIIRDEQEPPILAFQIHDNLSSLSELLGWSPVLLISPFLKEIFELSQTKIDGYLINEESEAGFSNNDLIYKEDQFDQSLLKWIKEKNYTAINLFCDYDLMIDLFQKLKVTGLSIPLVFFTENGKYILKPESKFRKWYPSKANIDILNDHVKNTENLMNDDVGYLVVKDGFVSIEVEEDLILIREK